MHGTALLSELLGYTSIACWLGAQLPQVVENFRRQSCDGLALPFLANWFLGDFSNFMGCILTHQLPFQTYLATYFVFIDSALLVQYIHYEFLSKPRPRLPPTTYPQTVTTSHGSLDKVTTRYRTLSIVAANVAAAAALAAQREPDNRRSDLLHSEGPYASSTHQEQSETDIHGYGASGLADSFHSEGGRATGKRRVSWSVERHSSRPRSVGGLSTIASSVISHTPLAYVTRGRSLGRNPEDPAGDPEATIPDSTFSPSMAEARRNSRAGKRSATMVFLGAWALFGVGTIARNRADLDIKTPMNVGRVLSATHTQDATTPVTAFAFEPTMVLQGQSIEANGIFLSFENQNTPPIEPPSHEPHHFTERILGRMFAWLCTTLYLTSRLPQIWKNYVRKSVEGLSMYLFVFAFLGNVFYVASILSSPNLYLPPPRSTEFLRQSIPYLLGSAGTLMFDITIVIQSFLYKPKHKRQHAKNKSSTAIEAGTAEEISGLLAGDALAKHHYSTDAPIPSSHVDRSA
ncbi:hypothetical protein AGABI2DRAFT_190426, partial [Agaricus bisporus var. bisporus H97]|uniref:hypothetical protein n=1 Tax=Agaricus bisporus var. bisporus (strain H97 / ATCC MYA-4626 / FGSC 10389) TaxID=936046 RepID=UPI00029F621C